MEGFLEKVTFQWGAEGCAGVFQRVEILQAHAPQEGPRSEIQMMTKCKWGCDSHGGQDGPSEIHLVIPQTLMGCPGLKRLRVKAKLRTALGAAVGDPGQGVR